MNTPDFRRTAQHTALFAVERQVALDAALTEALGEYRWDLDLAARALTFRSEDRELSGRADLLASVAARPATLLWAWSSQLIDLVGPDPLAERLREHGTAHRLPALTAEELDYDLPEGQDQREVIAEVAHEVGRIGLEVFGPEALYYTFPAGGGSRGCVLLRDLPLELPPVRLESIATALGRSAAMLDDIGWAFDGLARLLPGWQAQPGRAADGASVDVIADAQGRRLSATSTLDEHGRIARLSVTIEAGEPPMEERPEVAGAAVPAQAPVEDQGVDPAPRRGPLAGIRRLFGA